MSALSYTAVLLTITAGFAYANYLLLRLPRNSGLLIIAICVSVALRLIEWRFPGLGLASLLKRELGQLNFGAALLNRLPWLSAVCRSYQSRCSAALAPQMDHSGARNGRCIVVNVIDCRRHVLYLPQSWRLGAAGLLRRSIQSPCWECCALALVTGTYAVSEAIGVSGPVAVAVVVAGLLMGSIGVKYAVRETTHDYLQKVWSQPEYQRRQPAAQSRRPAQVPRHIALDLERTARRYLGGARFVAAVERLPIIPDYRGLRNRSVQYDCTRPEPAGHRE